MEPSLSFIINLTHPLDHLNHSCCCWCCCCGNPTNNESRGGVVRFHNSRTRPVYQMTHQYERFMSNVLSKSKWSKPFFPLCCCASLPNKMFFNLWARRQIPLSVLHLYCRMLNCGRCIFLSYWLVLCTDSSEKMPFWDPFDIGRKMTTFKRVATAVSLEKQREVKNNFLLRCAAHCYLAALQLWLVMNHAT